MIDAHGQIFYVAFGDKALLFQEYGLKKDWNYKGCNLLEIDNIKAHHSLRFQGRF